MVIMTRVGGLHVRLAARLTSHKSLLKVSEVKFNASCRAASESRGRLVSPGFELYYKFTRGKMIGMCCIGSGVKYHSLSPIGQSSHDVTGRSFDQRISCQTGMKSVV